MALRLTTWNVNGIRNPFGYQPWRDKRSFEAMFDILESDIICLQETKIQRKDLRDDMVLVPGFDCYWSLPRHKKGYSGVVIYTRNSKCAPIRAEEGVTGILSPPNSETCFRDLDPDKQIGGYPTVEQVSEVEIDLATLDSEGRCVVLEFPAFVLLGTYCPAERDETRTHFRTAFLKLLDWRIRNLIKMGKNVVWMGDLNISSNTIDTAMAEEMQRRNGVDHIGWISTPARRLFNQLIMEGEVHGPRDDGREEQVMWDVCRDFHRGRKGMYTCWETRVNARPGNYGARIDYIVCNFTMKDWWANSNIQEGLMGSDHCPVYGVLKDRITISGEETHILDVMNPPGMFQDGIRKQEWSSEYLLPMSGRLITEFDKRRNIKDMFSRRSPEKALLSDTSTARTSFGGTASDSDKDVKSVLFDLHLLPSTNSSHSMTTTTVTNTKRDPAKRSLFTATATTAPSLPPAKRAKTDIPSKGQQSLKGFFTATATATTTSLDRASSARSSFNTESSTPLTNPSIKQLNTHATTTADNDNTTSPPPTATNPNLENSTTKTPPNPHSWTQVFSKPPVPTCAHNEPCQKLLTKKPGINCGRSFWMCARPLGPSGMKEKGTEWRCGFFLWCSEWNSRGRGGEGET